ncbi:MAG: TAXI family TRAP transporter solute-binding subunit [Bacteroidota bacterium]|nr:TAXI family TRAP transporter solute-binding subunit [Bacteroidota bacterium]
MKNKKLLSFIFATLLISSSFLAQSQIRMLSGFFKGSYYEMANDIKIVAKDIVNVDTIFTVGANGQDSIAFSRSKSEFLHILTSKGSLHNFKKLSREEKPQVAFMQYDVLIEQQLKDIKKYKKRTDSIRVLIPLGFEEIHLIALKDSKIKKIKDLKKKKVAVGEAQQGTSVTAGLIKEKLGAEWIDVQVSFKDALFALLNHKIDAFFFVGSAPVSKLNGLSPTYRKLKIIPIKDKSLEEIYTKTTIPANTYHWLDKDVETYAVRLLLVSDISKESQADDKNLRKLLTDIQNNIGKLQEEGHPNWKKVDFNFSDIQWQVHDVAKKVFGL